MSINPNSSPLNRGALRQLKINLKQALNSSNQAQSNFESLGDKGDWWGFGSMSDSMREASWDTVEINSSHHGRSVLNSLSGLESLQREMGQLANSGSNSHGATVAQLRNALRTAEQSGVPSDVRRDIAEALSSATGGDYSVEGAKSNVDSAKDARRDISYGAREVAGDTTPGEWDYGTDVSGYADSASRGIDNARDSMSEASSDAKSAAQAHQSTAYDTRDALNTVDSYLRTPDHRDSNEILNPFDSWPN